MDPVLTEVIANALSSVSEEMQWTLFRTGYSTVIRESEDASSAVLDRHGVLIAFSGTLPYHMGVYETAAASLLVRYPVETLGQGDAFIVNHPYESGCPHISDFCVLVPYFRGGNLVGFCCNTAHKPDIGGSVPGSGSGSATELFQEGTLVPLTRFFFRGERIGEVYHMLRANSRAPDLLVGDLEAQVGTATMGCKRLDEVLDRFGAETVLETFDLLLETTRRRIEKVVSTWNRGVYHATGYLDNDGVRRDRRVKIALRLEINEDGIIFDFSDSDDQTVGPTNLRPSLVEAACAYEIRCFAEEDIPFNGGFRKAIQVVCRPGSVLNPRFPGPVSCYVHPLHRVSQVVLLALGQVMPEKATACASVIGAMIIGSNSPNLLGGSYSHYEIVGGAYGASAEGDGASGVDVHLTNCRVTPIEIIETEYPTRILRFELCRDSGGPGRFRGGLGYRRVYEMLADGPVLTRRDDGHEVPAPGLQGGLPGKPARFVINPETPREKEMPGKFGGFVLSQGDRLLLERGGGGGFGNPLERPAEKVLEDVRNGYVSTESAWTHYGVRIRDEEIDEKETARARMTTPPVD